MLIVYQLGGLSKLSGCGLDNETDSGYLPLLLFHAVDEHARFCGTDTIDQRLCISVQAETAECAFYGVVTMGNGSHIQEHF